ncbi:zinc metalloprotease HtpX [Microgenomates group bacterium RIFCSPLOWO2_01_FULL_47_10]|nr:MAG: zinc metalloprotease HtpX [Microgenomates group bacterium RIFCSPLOWO2_01_FULL_47_10]
MQNVFELVDANKRKSSLVVAGFIVFVALVSWVFAVAYGYDLSFVGIAFIFSGLVSYVSFYNSDKIILSLSGARPADRQKDFNFYTVAQNLSMAARIPMPKLYVIDDTALNAFATGRDPQHAVVVATTGLLTALNRTELEGVVAHEFSHIQNYDIRLMSLVTVMVGMITLLADMFLRMSRFGGRRSRDTDNQLGTLLFVVGIILALLSPFIAGLIKLAISRRREFLADASGAKLTRYPEGLARALEKISADQEPLEAANKATAHLYIANPLKNHHDSIGWFAGMFNTHPPVAERIAALRSR